ncbi:MAG: DUF4173 domain-containing protein [Gemmatimonadetes bacterium]|uniref:DUF4173 domain-containing protein n=1 Tax=Candidatus Kutchimonas denitrificans TaxID=3056748 RepID=A0AAE4Z957_9BACT|nr:DUF4173 domain-containing protein [Gemmatimonadota bacterium]NIR76100.1 DUF4173 domain-containing protein [Candidatus Kutchimonas denitrificans]NIS00479.1 DUF4173 domain-containing protein [Gemmatimonadota bacterium]NIT66137.1 DUF4173 domain-containing protein [Gemmatimonadota bacterium]NIU54215.1 DUF4173 domain-containing protein [Gemmatimonadota bacterium]
MERKSRLAREILIAGVTLGVLGDALLRAGPWSLNLTLWATLVVFAAMTLAGRNHVAWPRDGLWFAAPVLLFALAFAWRDSLALKFLNLVAMLTGISVWSLALAGSRISISGIADYARGMVDSGAAALIGATALARSELIQTAPPSSATLRHARAATVGLLIAVPLLFVFGGLLMAADAVFDRMVTTALDIDFANLMSHGMLTGFFAWIVCGFFLLILGVARPFRAEMIKIGRPPLGVTEIALPLALIDLLFAAFVLVQMRYLFGDAALVQDTVGLTYAEYARRGFFELVTVTALVLPLLLAADWILGPSSALGKRLFRGLAGAMLALLLIIVASAMTRMQLYQDAYGLTELRLYTTAFMAWLGIVLAWFAVTVLAGRRRFFATGALLAAFSLVGALNLINADEIIARVNTTRAIEGKEFDARYASSLSADAVPVLLSALPRLEEEHRCIVAARLLERWSPPTATDWRTWNVARGRAWRSVRRASDRLERSACSAESRRERDADHDAEAADATSG